MEIDKKFLDRLDKQNLWLRVLIVLLFLTSYLLVFIPLHGLVGDGVFSFFALLVGMAGLLLGMQGGLFFALLNYPLAIFLALKVGFTSDAALRSASFGALPMIILGMGAGRLRDLSIQVKRELQERRLTEKALRDSEEKYRSIFENAQVGVFRTRISDGLVLDGNKRLAEMFGYENIEDSIFKFSALDFYVEPGTREKVLAGFQHGELKNFEANFYRKDGSTFWALASGRIYPDKGYTEGVVTDITDIKRTEAELQYRINFINLINRISTDFVNLRSDEIDQGINRALETVGEFAAVDRAYVFLLSEDGRKTDNTYEWCGTGIEPQIQHLQGILLDRDLPWFTEKIRKLEVVHLAQVAGLPPEASAEKAIFDSGRIQSLVVVPMVYRHRLRGFLRFDSVRQEKTWSKDNITLLKIVGEIIINALERQQAEKTLLKMEKISSLGILAGGIAHDFNNILTGILGNISLAVLTFAGEPEIYPILQDTEKAALRAKELAQQLLTFAKGGAPVKQLASLIEIIQDSISFACRGSQAVYEFTCTEELWAVEIDHGQISQVFQNLALNAVQSMPNGGTITIRVENLLLKADSGLPLKEGKYVRISLQDQGVGIAPDILPKIFDPYFTTKPEGSGLGLAAAYSIINKHDGLITVESTLGEGTTFHVFVPASEKQLPSPSEVDREILTGTGKILVMDDKELVRQVVGKILHRLGYEAEFAQHGTEALGKYVKAQAAGEPFDAVILDLTIPGGMGGKETIEQLLEIDPQAKAIVSSGYADDPTMTNYLDVGFSGIIKKPYRIHEVGREVKRVLTENRELLD
jgi:PAS domain S-box-containing protein